jgi:predicted nucleotidyltransferase
MIELNTVQNVISNLANKYQIKKLSCFGSYAEGKQTEDSDIDFLVEFMTPSVSILMLVELWQILEDQLGLKVDLIHAPIPPGAYIKINKTVLIYERT